MSYSDGWYIGGDYDAWKTTPPEDEEEEFDPRDDEPPDLDEWRDEHGR